MSQYDFGNLESPLSGTSFFNTHLEPWRDAQHSNHAGGSRPSYAVASMTWVNNTTNPHVLNYFDGSQDIPLGYIDISTNSFIPAGLLLNNTSATANPSINDDSVAGYAVGSKWVNVTAALVFECVDSSTGAAVWKQLIDANSTQTMSGKTLTNPTINAASGSIILPQSPSASQTSEGEIVWDTDDDLLTVGTSSGRKIMVDTNSAQTLLNKALSGVTDGSVAGSGIVGQTLEAERVSASALSLTTATDVNITSLSIPAGRWLINASCAMETAGATYTSVRAAISLASATPDFSNGRAASWNVGTSSIGNTSMSLQIAPCIFNFTTTTTVYLVARAIFSAGSFSAYGKILAHRIW